MNEISSILIIAVVLLVIYLLFSLVRVVPDYKRLVVLQLGRYKGTRGPGVTLVIPLLEQAYSVDLREKFLDIPSQTAITRDNASIAIDFLVYYRIVEPMLAVLKVENVEQASVNIATTTLRAVIGDIELDEVLSKREAINDKLRAKLDESTERWGMKITSVEIREIQPPKAIMDAMNQQMTAERMRRAEVTRAEGERQAAISVAEGEKQSAILRAEGERQAILLAAQGYAAALAAIQDKAENLDSNTLMLQYLDTLQKIGASPSTKFIMPMEVTSLMERLGSMIAVSEREPAHNGQ
ncbi:MAG: SPFH/Band 7/PHB domain protein [Anaerolineae bacterium]|nr:SPFH/Band 7/PHB domain protein [Anaerolineae bacterium]MDW8173889.1 SPFH domain-containing protein [Anaerolineae bacterium]